MNFLRQSVMNLQSPVAWYIHAKVVLKACIVIWKFSSQQWMHSDVWPRLGTGSLKRKA